MTQLDLVILAAGRGSRLQDVGDDRPKWLLEVAGRTIATRQLEALSLLGADALRSTTVVTGHAASAIPPLPEGVETLHNPLYLELNNWYSVLTALRALPDEARVVVMNGDLCADPSWLAAFLRHCTTTEEQGVLAVDTERDLTDESMKVSGSDALETIGKVGVPSPTGEYVGLLMATGEVLKRFRAQLEDFATDPVHAQEWYEGAVRETAASGARWHLWPTPGSAWVEIDDAADLARAHGVVGG